MLYTLIHVIFPRVILYAGVLELVDEADSKSVGLIPRAGSTPATGTTKCGSPWYNGLPYFLFFCRRSPYIKRFSEYGGAKVLNTRVFLLCRRRAAYFCFAPPYGKNQKVDRFIKRLQRKIKLFLDIYLLRFSSSLGRVNVSTDKGIKQGLSRSNTDFGSPFFFIQLLLPAAPESGRTVGCKPCGVWILE